MWTLLLSVYLKHYHPDLRYNVKNDLYVWHNGKHHKIKRIRLAIDYGYGYKRYTLETYSGMSLLVPSSEYVYYTAMEGLKK